MPGASSVSRSARQEGRDGGIAAQRPEVVFVRQLRLVAQGIDHAEKAHGRVAAGAELVPGHGGDVDQVERPGRPDFAAHQHIGLTPQSINALGSFRSQGREEAEAIARGENVIGPIQKDARAVAQAGAFSVVVEAVAEPLARRITETIDIPTIGIGASAACDGQVLVLEDMLGLSEWVPKFVRRYGQLGPMIEEAIQGYANDVRSRAFPGPENVYGIKPKA